MTHIEVMQLALETAVGIANADWRKWEELASPEEFERWAKSRANQIATSLRQAIEQAEQQEPVATDWEQRALEAESLNERLIAEFNAENGPTFMGEPVIHTTPLTASEWEKLKDPTALHQNLLRGFPAQLTKDMLLHLLGQEYTGQPTAPNLNCKSVQKRLATSWGYVRKEEYDMARIAAARQMRDAAVKMCRDEADWREKDLRGGAKILWDIANRIANLSIKGGGRV